MPPKSKIETLLLGFKNKATAADSISGLLQFLSSTPKQLDREKTAVYIFKEVLDVYSELTDSDREYCDLLQKALRLLVDTGHTADDSLRCHFILRTYNLVVKSHGKEVSLFSVH